MVKKKLLSDLSMKEENKNLKTIIDRVNYYFEIESEVKKLCESLFVIEEIL